MPRPRPGQHNHPISLSTATLNTVEDDELDRTFAALADPTRRAILARLAEGEATVNMVARPFEMSLQAVSRHLKVLERAGLISRGRDAQWRPRTLRADPLKEAAAWLEDYRGFWEQSLAG